MSDHLFNSELDLYAVVFILLHVMNSNLSDGLQTSIIHKRHWVIIIGLFHAELAATQFPLISRWHVSRIASKLTHFFFHFKEGGVFDQGLLMHDAHVFKLS